MWALVYVKVERVRVLCELTCHSVSLIPYLVLCISLHLEALSARISVRANDVCMLNTVLSDDVLISDRYRYLTGRV